MPYTLLIGNKNYSSWSLRPWLLLKAFGIPFAEERYAFDTPEFATEISSGKRSPNGRVPVLIDGDIKIWDSLAIAEYLAEQHPNLWPADEIARAHARCACAEMHSGFQALRNWMPMNVRRSYPIAIPREDVQKDINRMQSLWIEARTLFGKDGSFLYGQFSIADAYFAPVVFRFNTYAVKLDLVVENYLQIMLKHPSMQQWVIASEAELKVVSHEEPESIYPS